MQQRPIKRDMPCPVCGAEPAYRVWGTASGCVFILNDLKRRFAPSHPEPLVCTICGYVQFFVNPDEFRTGNHQSGYDEK